ncbi:MAG: potassium/proton antiporter [Pseudomonadota bacterium]
MHAFNLLLLAGGLLVFISLLAGVASTRLGLPFLLVFLVAGMLVGVDGPIGVRFDNAQLAAWVGNAALAMILLEGGISTRMEIFRAGFRPALALATVGVVLTAAIVGAAAMAVMHIDWRHGLLLGAIVGSTDAAAVFSLLRQTGVRLSERVSATLELESGLNDPMAVFLVLALIATLKSDAGLGETLLLFARQAGFGAAIGLAAGYAVAWLLDKLPLNVEHGGVLSLIVVSAGMAVFAACGLVEGSGFLAIYLFGIRVRAGAEQAAHAASSALDGFAWAAQASMFLLLGLLVSPHDMVAALVPTLIVAAVLIFVARPLAVWLCLWPTGFGARQRAFIGWVGLRGAVPIVLALFPLIEKIPDSYRFFNAAFAVVLASLLLQGTTLGWVARKLGVVEPPETPPPERRAVQGRLTLDADLPLADVFGFFQLPLPEHSGTTLREWLTDNLARDHVEGDGIDWQGAHFRVLSLQDGRIARVGLALAQKVESAS